jgi:hypothetical protein
MECRRCRWTRTIHNITAERVPPPKSPVIVSKPNFTAGVGLLSERNKHAWNSSQATVAIWATFIGPFKPDFPPPRI